jgi:hypothetical protein
MSQLRTPWRLQDRERISKLFQDVDWIGVIISLGCTRMAFLGRGGLQEHVAAEHVYSRSR